MKRLRCWGCKDFKACIGEVFRLLNQACDASEDCEERRQFHCR